MKRILVLLMALFLLVVPVMGDPEYCAGESGECFQKLQLQLVFEIAVQRGKGLIQQNCPRLGGEDTRQRRSLLLPAGEGGGALHELGAYVGNSPRRHCDNRWRGEDLSFADVGGRTGEGGL